MERSLLYTAQTSTVDIWSGRFVPVLENLEDIFGGEHLSWDPRHLVPSSTAMLEDGHITVRRRWLSPKTTATIGNLGVQPAYMRSLLTLDMYAQKLRQHGEPHRATPLILGPFAVAKATPEDGERLDLDHVAGSHRTQVHTEPAISDAEALLKVKGDSVQDILRTIARQYNSVFPLSEHKGDEVAAAILGVPSFTEADAAITQAEAMQDPFGAALTVRSEIRIMQLRQKYLSNDANGPR
jgi:hypothetical protein